ncbi:MAG: hydroxyacid dehydrogenase [Woeseiaceae bacterium]
MPDVVISEFMDKNIALEVLDKLDVQYDPKLVDDRAALLETLAEARAIIVRNRTQVDSELLDHAPNLKVVGRLGVGLDNIDLEACKARSVVVCPATGANDIAVAEYAITAALVLLRGAWSASDRMIAGEWPRTDLMGREMSGKRLGLVGFGSIARQVATRAMALGMSVSAFDPYLAADDPAWSDVRTATLADLAADCDVISIHVPLTEKTRHLIGVEFIRSMRAGSILINTARGGVVDESALVEALREDRLGGAALDVFQSEPLDSKNGAAFAGVPNVLMTPHIAGITEEANQRVSLVTVQNVLKHL